MTLPVSPYIFVPAIAWILSQTIKYLLHTAKAGSLTSYSFLYTSGNMPSSHAAVTVSLLTVIGHTEGLSSALFGVMAILTMIVLYDAVNVRRAVGEQGKFLQNLAKTNKERGDFYTAKGHTIVEVTVGSILGFLIAVIFMTVFSN